MRSDKLAHSGALPTLYLDHVMVTLPIDTFHSVSESDLVRRQLGRFKAKQADSSLAGVYSSVGLAGENTLVELFDASTPIMPGVTGGLVFSFPLPGSAEAARDLLQATCLTPVDYQLVLRAQASAAERQPWYHLLRANLGADSPFLLFLSEVTPAYFAHLGATTAPDGRMERREYLNAALGSSWSPAHHLRDLTGVTVRLCSDRASAVVGVLQALGYAVETSADRLLVRGPDVTVHVLVDDASVEGVVEIRMALTRPVPAAKHGFGRGSEIALEGSEASWTFDPVRPGGCGPVP